MSQRQPLPLPTLRRSQAFRFYVAVAISAIALAEEQPHLSGCDTASALPGDCQPIVEHLRNVGHVQDEENSCDTDGAFLQTIVRVDQALAAGSAESSTIQHSGSNETAQKARDASLLDLRLSTRSGHGHIFGNLTLVTTLSNTSQQASVVHNASMKVLAGRVCGEHYQMYLPVRLAFDLALLHVLRKDGYLERWLPGSNASMPAPCRRPELFAQPLAGWASGTSMGVGSREPTMSTRSYELADNGVLLSTDAEVESYGSLHPGKVVAILYVVFLGLAIVYMFSVALQTQPQTVAARPGTEAWKRGVFSWMMTSWATNWVAKWGNADYADATKVKPHDIGCLGDEEDDSGPCFERFQQIWKAEIEAVGEANANLMQALYKFIGLRRWLLGILWTGVFECTFYFVPPLAIEWITGYISWLYAQRESGLAVHPDGMLSSTLTIILIFTGLPCLGAAGSSISKLVNARISANIAGALSIAVYDKAMRLPVNVQHTVVQQLEETKSVDGDRSTAAKQSDTSSPAASVEDVPEDDAPPTRNTQYAESPETYNLVQLVMTDINENIVQFEFAAVRAIVLYPIALSMFILLCCKIRFAGVYATLMLTVLGVISLCSGCGIAGSTGAYFFNMGKRLDALQHYLHGIRFIKGIGAESVVEKKMLSMREIEYPNLTDYHRALGRIVMILQNAGKFIFIAAISSYVWTYGHIASKEIFMLVPLVTQFQVSVAALMEVTPAMFAAIPSFKRVQDFLRQANAPGVHENHQEKANSSVTLWPKAGASMPLVVKGDFAWAPRSVPLLRSIDLSIPRGSLVAVVGSVGSGKTSLMHAILGELYPHGHAQVQRPAAIAYSAQVPNIIEGTLKQNVVFGYPFDEDRFDSAIEAAGLLTDLELLGGTEVAVGAHGISLSVGQKARISMARAAYSMDTDVVILDDPFAALDANTASSIVNSFFGSQIMEGRTRIVVCQPEKDLIERSDCVIVMEHGQIKEQGPTAQIVETIAYKELLAQRPPEAQHQESKPEQQDTPRRTSSRNSVRLAETRGTVAYRDEEFKGRPSWETLEFFFSLGGYLNFWGSSFLSLVAKLVDIVCGVVLAWWTNDAIAAESGHAIEISERYYQRYYIYRYILWTIVATVACRASWFFLIRFTGQFRIACHDKVLTALLRAPIDRFYDKTPVGRIMSRVATDVVQCDTKVAAQLQATCGMVIGVVVPLFFVHIVMPFWFFLLCLPLYALSIKLTTLYWNTMVPFRYLTCACKSFVDIELAEIENNRSTVRAYRKVNERLLRFQSVVDEEIACDFSSITILERWFCARVYFLGAGLATLIGLAAIWVPNIMSVGIASLCLVQVFTLITTLELNVLLGCASQYELISLNRVRDYTQLPQEGAPEMHNDARYRNLHVKINSRAELGSLKVRSGPNGIQIVRDEGGEEEVLLEQVPSKSAFRPAAGRSLTDLTGAPELQQLDPWRWWWYRISAVNGIHGDVQKMATELCNNAEPSEPISLYVTSGWLADGAQVAFEGLVAGYGEIQRNVLQGINLVIPPKAKAGIVGATGSGKSTMLLCVLRIIEPRAGRVKIENIDTSSIGLRTLRSSLGFVPQEPVLMLGNIKSNIDPFNMYSDECIWEALRDCQLESHVQSCEGQLEHEVSQERSSLSFGQRQLLSIARMLLQQPPVLLLDEATSAMDPAMQNLVQSSMETCFPDSTMLCVTHRLETLLNFDLVVVLDQGRVVEKGSVKTLSSAKGGIFANMLASGIKLGTGGSNC